MIEARRYQVKVRAAVQMSSIPRWPRNSLLRRMTLTSSRNDLDQDAENPACRSPTRFFFGTLRLARKELPSKKILRATAASLCPCKKIDRPPVIKPTLVEVVGPG